MHEGDSESTPGIRREHAVRLGWLPYDRIGSYFKADGPYLLQLPMNADGSMQSEPGTYAAEVDFNQLSPQEARRFRAMHMRLSAVLHRTAGRMAATELQATMPDIEK